MADRWRFSLGALLLALVAHGQDPETCLQGPHVSLLQREVLLKQRSMGLDKEPPDAAEVVADLGNLTHDASVVDADDDALAAPAPEAAAQAEMPNSTAAAAQDAATADEIANVIEKDFPQDSAIAKDMADAAAAVEAGLGVKEPTASSENATAEAGKEIVSKVDAVGKAAQAAEHALKASYMELVVKARSKGRIARAIPEDLKGSEISWNCNVEEKTINFVACFLPAGAGEPVELQRAERHGPESGPIAGRFQPEVMKQLIAVWKRLADVFPSSHPGGRAGALDCGLEDNFEICKKLGASPKELPQIRRFLRDSPNGDTFGGVRGLAKQAAVAAAAAREAAAPAAHTPWMRAQTAAAKAAQDLDTAIGKLIKWGAEGRQEL